MMVNPIAAGGVASARSLRRSGPNRLAMRPARQHEVGIVVVRTLQVIRHQVAAVRSERWGSRLLSRSSYLSLSVSPLGYCAPLLRVDRDLLAPARPVRIVMGTRPTGPSHGIPLEIGRAHV